MATDLDVARLRRLVDEPTTDTYNDQALRDLIASYGDNVDIAAAEIWEEKAAKFARMVNVKEGPSSRDLGDLYTNAIKMAAFFASGGADSGSSANVARTRPAVREGGF